MNFTSFFLLKKNVDLIHAIFKLLWSRRALGLISYHEKLEGTNALVTEAWAGISKKGRLMTDAMQRAATIAEAEGVGKIEATHLERILLQLLLDF
ncbi:hypothetical protein UlMin_042285 [Ulmus minor]